MRLGIVRERARGESRVALTPYAVNELTRAGHRLLVESGAGDASSIPDGMYSNAGAKVVYKAAEVIASRSWSQKYRGRPLKNTNTCGRI